MRKTYTDSLGRSWKWNEGLKKYDYVRKVDIRASLYPDLDSLSSNDVNSIIQLTKRKDRMFPGQKVQYLGKRDSSYSGKSGTLIATGKGGAAVIKFADGHITYSRWANVKAQGTIKAQSIYDGLGTENVHKIKGKLASRVFDVMAQRISGSSVTLRELYEEFKKRGFTLMLVGGTVRDLLQGKDAKDLDFIVDSTDNEIKQVIQSVDKSFLNNAIFNSKIGLVSFRDLDFTPIHMHDPTIGMAKGGTLKDDAASRDFAVNSLQIDPVRGVLIDATGKGVQDIGSNALHFSDASYLSSTPRYLLRFFKFVSRGYRVPATTRMHVLKNLKSVRKLSSSKLQSFFERQIGDKDGIEGLDKVKEAFRQYDKRLWDDVMQLPYSNVRSELVKKTERLSA